MNIKDKSRIQITLAFTLIFFVELIRTAWIGDDIGFTLRSILNFYAGNGPQFNIGERVQSFTHPLWFLFLTTITFLTKNVLTATFLSSIFLSTVVFWLLIKNKNATQHGTIVAACILLFSRSFVEYSTSGLENPLTNLFLLVAILNAQKAYFSPSAKYLIRFLLALSFMYLSRPDSILLLIPACITVFHKNFNDKKKLITAVLVASIPIIIWTSFSIIYYGSFFPNTAYAKLNTGIPTEQFIFQGILYFLNSLGEDSITIPILFVAIILACFGSGLFKSFALGIVFYLIYILYIGGDFMSGRFFATPLLLAAYLFSVFNYNKNEFRTCLVSIFILAVPNLAHTLVSELSNTTGRVSGSGIADEKGYYYNKYGLLNLKREDIAAYSIKNPTIVSGKNVEVRCNKALEAIHSGRLNDHIVVDCALADPLLSRLPVNINEGWWRIGHYFRMLPDGYIETLEYGQNRISDPLISEFYNKLKLVLSGNLISKERLYAIYDINFSNYRNLFEFFLKKGIRFDVESPSYFVTKNLGFSTKEIWGRWSDAQIRKYPLIQFIAPLPKRFNLIIEAKGFDQNVGLPTIIKIGNVEKRVTLERDFTTYSIPFNLTEWSNEVEIIPPAPISPSQIDPKNLDTRKLGIGIKSIKFSF